VTGKPTATPSISASRSSSAAPLPPICPGAWLLGNAWALLRDPGAALTEGFERRGPVYRLRAAWRGYVVIAGTAAADFMAQGLDKAYLSRHRIFGAVQKEFGKSDLVLAQSGAGHARLRAPLALAYSRQVASPFVPAMIDAVRRHARRWQAGATRGVLDEVREMAFAQYREMLGTPPIAYRDCWLVTDYMMNVAGRFLPAIVFKAPWYRAAHGRTYRALATRVRELRAAPAGGPPTILDTLASVRDASGIPFSDDAVVSYGAYGVGAACGYVGRLAAFMLYEILRDRQLYEEITNEVDRAFSRGLRDATDVRRMRILRSVYDETLRFHPIALGMPFHAEADFEYQGWRIRKGDFVVISPTPSSFSPGTYRDPHRFDAARCREPRNEHRRDGTCRPFGLGDRTCSGAGMVELMAMTLVGTLLHGYDLAMEPPTYRLRLKVRPLPAPDSRFRMRTASRPEVAKSPAPPPARELIEEEALAAFPGCDEPTVQRELSRATRERFDPGAVIVREGDEAHAFYLVERGHVTVTRSIRGTTERLADLGEGEWFGEAGLLQNAPRNATVTAGAGGADALVLDRDAFLRIVAESDLVATEIGQLMRKRLATIRLMQAAPTLSVSTAALVLPEFGWRSYEAGQTIIRRGDTANDFFVIVDGEVVVSRPDASGSEAVVARLGPGDYFGEMGLLHGAPRNATVAAAGHPVRVLVTSRAGFERLLAEGGTRGELARAMLARLERGPSG
jgi:CRP-like cAMP-binding protein/cytochrome P450